MPQGLDRVCGSRSGNIPALRTLLLPSLGLVTVEAPSSTTQPVRFILQGHLSGDSTLLHNHLPTFAEVCFTYFNFRHVRVLSPTLH